MSEFDVFSFIFWSIFFIIPGIVYLLLKWNSFVCPECGTPPGHWV